MRHPIFSSSIVLLLASSAFACSASPAAEGTTAESQFTAPRLKELMSSDGGIGLVTSVVDRAGGVHAVVRNSNDVVYITNANADRSWTTKTITSTKELLTKMGHDPASSWVAIQQTAIAVDEDRKVTVAFELDSDASGTRRHTLFAMEGINGTQPVSPVAVAEGPHSYDFGLDASRGRLHLAFFSADPNATKMDELQYASGTGATWLASTAPCTGDSPNDWTTRKRIKVDHDASGRVHVLCAGGQTLSHAVEATPGSGSFGTGEVVPNPEMSYPDTTMMGVAPSGALHVTHMMNGRLASAQREASGAWSERTYFDASVGAPQLGPWEHPTYPMVAQSAQWLDRAGQPVRVALINETSKDGMLEKQTLTYFAPDLARHDIAELDVNAPVWNLTFTVSPTDGDAIVLFTTMGGKTTKLWVAE